MLSERLNAVSCQDITSVLYNQQLDYHIQNSPSLILVMCHFNAVQTSTPCISRLHWKSITQQVHVVIPPWNGTREVLNSNLGRESGYSGRGRGLVVFFPSHQEHSGILLRLGQALLFQNFCQLLIID